MPVPLIPIALVAAGSAGAWWWSGRQGRKVADDFAAPPEGSASPAPRAAAPKPASQTPVGWAMGRGPPIPSGGGYMYLGLSNNYIGILAGKPPSNAVLLTIKGPPVIWNGAQINSIMAVPPNTPQWDAIAKGIGMVTTAGLWYAVRTPTVVETTPCAMRSWERARTRHLFGSRRIFITKRSR
jgi:hypothetical protein